MRCLDITLKTVKGTNIRETLILRNQSRKFSTIADQQEKQLTRYTTTICDRNRHRKSPCLSLYSVIQEYKLYVLPTYCCLQAFVQSEVIKFAFSFLFLFVSKARQSESGPSSNCSPVSMSSAPSTFSTTANIMNACLLPFSSWYLW